MIAFPHVTFITKLTHDGRKEANDLKSLSETHVITKQTTTARFVSLIEEHHPVALVLSIVCIQ